MTPMIYFMMTMTMDKMILCPEQTVATHTQLCRFFVHKAFVTTNRDGLGDEYWILRYTKRECLGG